MGAIKDIKGLIQSRYTALKVRGKLATKLTDRIGAQGDASIMNHGTTISRYLRKGDTQKAIEYSDKQKAIEDERKFQGNRIRRYGNKGITIPTKSKINKEGEIMNPTKNDIAEYNRRYKTVRMK